MSMGPDWRRACTILVVVEKKDGKVTEGISGVGIIVALAASDADTTLGVSNTLANRLCFRLTVAGTKAILVPAAPIVCEKREVALLDTFAFLMAGGRRNMAVEDGFLKSLRCVEMLLSSLVTSDDLVATEVSVCCVQLSSVTSCPLAAGRSPNKPPYMVKDVMEGNNSSKMIE